VGRERRKGSRDWRQRLRWWPAVPLILLSGPLGGSAGADLDVQARNGQLTLRVRSAPLVDVLQTVSHKTGLKVVYEGRRPSQLVTANIEGLPEAEALGRLFEGLGINYVFQSDATGRRVDLLIISAGSTSGPSAVSPPVRPQAPAFVGRDVEPVEPDEPPQAGESEDEPPEPANPNQPFPSTDANQGSAPGVTIQPSPAPVPFSTPVMARGGLAPPSFPSQASHPVPAPVFPPNASYPSRAPFD
jgi:hypothetical protein